MMASRHQPTNRRPAAYHSALQSTQEGRGFNSWIPMPFRDRIRIELLNAAPRRIELYYQLDLVLGPLQEDSIEASGTLAGSGWHAVSRGDIAWFGICERQDDYCATAYVYCRAAQPVPRLDLALATTDVARFSYETGSRLEAALGGAG